jgi:hypothetical protein
MRSLQLGVFALLAWPAVADAQQSSSQVGVPIRIVVQPVLAIRSVVAGPVRIDASNGVQSAAHVHVESNLPYRLTVRRAAPADRGAVLVRHADGTFEQLTSGASVTAVSPAGQRTHEIVCRVEGDAAEPNVDRCALIYEVSAEFHDMLIRSAATGPSLRPAIVGLRHQTVGESLTLVDASRGF